MRTILAMVAVAAGLPAALADESVYAVTREHLLLINQDDPGASTVIGSHGLAVTENNGKQYGAFSMTYDSSTDQLLGLYYRFDQASGVFDQLLVEYDRDTGAATIVDLVASSDLDGFVEAIEYVEGVGAVVLSQDLDGSQTTSLAVLNGDGTRTELTDSGRDNDYAVYDQTRDRFYTTDPNGVGRLSHVDLSTGSTTDLGSIRSSYGDMAYSAERDEILGFDVATGELVSLGNGVNSQNGTPIGLVNTTGSLQGLAVVTEDAAPPPCPADFNGDGVVNYSDLHAYIRAFLRGHASADWNGDGRIRFWDLVLYYYEYKHGC